MSMQIMSHVALACKDQVATEAFYTNYLGFRRVRVFPVDEDEQIVFIKMQDCAFYLELFRAKEDSPLPAPTNDGPWYPTIRHLAFKVDSVDAKLAEMGNAVQVMQGPMDFDDFIPGWRTVWVSDPDGNIVEISEGFMDSGGE
ncbi:MAG: VOC family protein [Candidatus Thiodiazotropha sp. (ex Epidulcina cf. delphinae)]|nr:VOC family protein [Candidatus Thiodiazotropha sp. (ex Epidulcina cf. delphinae)]